MAQAYYRANTQPAYSAPPGGDWFDLQGAPGGDVLEMTPGADGVWRTGIAGYGGPGGGGATGLDKSYVGGVPPGGWQAWFEGLRAGVDPSSQGLTSLAPALAQYGARLENPNQAGITSKIVLPTGEIVRVGGHFDSAPAEGFARSWDWVSQPGTGAGGGAYGGGYSSSYGSAPAPVDIPEFSYAPWEERFTAPTYESVTGDQGFQARLTAAQQALERSAAAKGTLLTGGTVRALGERAQEFASNEYNQAYGRALGEYQQRYGQYSDAYNRALTEYGQRYGRASDAYSRARQAYEFGLTNEQQQQQTRYNQLYGLASLGYNAAAGAGNIGSGVSDYYTQQGNARAAGQAGSASAYGNALGQVGQLPLAAATLSAYGNYGRTSDDPYGIYARAGVRNK